MLIDIWKIKTIKKNGIRTQIRCDKIDISFLYKDKNKGYKVRYTCDKCKSNKINITTSSTFFRENVVYNTLEYQICRSCRSRISEYEIKKTQINYDIIKKSIDDNKYVLLSKKEDYENSNNRSQTKLNCLCSNGHNFIFTWNNWNKGKRCRVCYEQDKKNNAVKYKEGFELYYYLVWLHSNKNYRKYSNIINPNNFQRKLGNKGYHLDHIYSIYDGFKNNVPVYLMTCVSNLRIISGSKNISKGKKSDITIEELFERFNQNKLY